jgi:hypothetical protein
MVGMLVLWAAVDSKGHQVSAWALQSTLILQNEERSLFHSFALICKPTTGHRAM